MRPKCVENASPSRGIDTICTQSEQSLTLHRGVEQLLYTLLPKSKSHILYVKQYFFRLFIVPIIGSSYFFHYNTNPVLRRYLDLSSRHPLDTAYSIGLHSLKLQTLSWHHSC